MNPSPKSTDQEKKNVMNSFDSSSQDQCIETDTKRILTYILMSWNEEDEDSDQQLEKWGVEKYFWINQNL